MSILPVTTLARVGLVIDAIAILIYVGVLVVVDSLGDARAMSLGPPLLAMAVGSVLSLIAILRQGERALLAWLALVPGVLVVLALIAELTGLME